MVYNWKTLLKWMIWGENPLFSETSIFQWVVKTRPTQKGVVYAHDIAALVASLALPVVIEVPLEGCPLWTRHL